MSVHAAYFGKDDHLLGILRNHENKLEAVHPKGNVVQPFRIRQEDDVLDRIFHDVLVLRCTSPCQHEQQEWMMKQALQLQKHTQASLIVRWLLADVCGEDCLDVFDEIYLEQIADRVAEGVDLVK